MRDVLCHCQRNSHEQVLVSPSGGLSGFRVVGFYSIPMRYPKAPQRPSITDCPLNECLKFITELLSPSGPAQSLSRRPKSVPKKQKRVIKVCSTQGGRFRSSRNTAHFINSIHSDFPRRRLRLWLGARLTRNYSIRGPFDLPCCLEAVGNFLLFFILCERIVLVMLFHVSFVALQADSNTSDVSHESVKIPRFLYSLREVPSLGMKRVHEWKISKCRSERAS